MEQKFFARDPWFWAGFLVGGFFLGLTLWFGLGMDQSIYCYGAWVWRHYHLPPYVGIFEHNYPGIFLVNYLAMGLFGESTLGFRFFDFLVQTSCLPMIFHLARKLAGTGLAGFFAAVFYGIYYYSLGANGAGQRETFIFWLLLLCTVLALTMENRFWLRAFIIGLLLGGAFLLKPFYGLAWPVFGVLFLSQGLKKRPVMVWLESSLFGLCCLAPALIFVLAYWRLGYINQLYLNTVWFNSEIYTQMTDPFAQRLVFATRILPLVIFRDYPLLLLPAILAGVLQAWKGGLVRDKTLFALLGSMLFIGLFSYFLQGKYFPYQLAVFMGMACIFSGWASGLAWLALSNLSRSRPAKTMLLISGLVWAGINITSLDSFGRFFAVHYCFRNFIRAYLAGYGTPRDSQLSANYYLAAQYLKPLIRPHDRIACFGPYPLVPFLLRQRLPTYFPCVHHLLLMRKDGKVLPQQKQWIQEFSSDIIQAGPRFIIVSDRFPGFQDKFFNFINREVKVALEEQFPELDHLIKNNYRPLKVIGHVLIYELSEPESKTLKQ